MQLSALFENIDVADRALARLRQEGVRFRSTHHDPQHPPGEEYQNSHFLAFPSAYDPYQMMFPYEVPHLNPCVIASPDNYYPGFDNTSTVLSLEVPEYDLERAKQIIINQHGTDIRLS